MHSTVKLFTSLTSLIVVTLSLAACTTVEPPSLEKSETKPTEQNWTVYEDSPENRELVNNALLQYQQVKKDHGKTVRLNGIDLFYLEWGDETGTPLIWSHGYSSRSFELMKVADRLVAAGYRVIALDNRGHGDTQVNDYNFSLSHIADDINALMDDLKIEKAIIGGLSLGGSVTTTFYDHYPERVLALILEDGGSDHIQSRIEKHYPYLKDLKIGYGPDSSKEYSSRFAAFQGIAGLYQSAWQQPLPLDLYPILASQIVEAKPGVFRLHHNGLKLWGEGTSALRNPSKAHELPLLHQSWRRVHPLITYRNLHVPMLIIDPVDDFNDLSEQNERLKSLHPDLITVLDYPDTPHAAHPFRPSWFVRDLTNFLHNISN